DPATRSPKQLHCQLPQQSKTDDSDEISESGFARADPMQCYSPQSCKCSLIEGNFIRSQLIRRRNARQQQARHTCDFRMHGNPRTRTSDTIARLYVGYAFANSDNCSRTAVPGTLRLVQAAPHCLNG